MQNFGGVDKVHYGLFDWIAIYLKKLVDKSI